MSRVTRKRARTSPLKPIAVVLGLLLILMVILAPAGFIGAGRELLARAQQIGGGSLRLAVYPGDKSAAALAQGLAEGAGKLGGTVELVETASIAENLERIREGSADAAITITAGKQDWNGTAGLAAGGTCYVHVIVPASSQILDIRGIAGKRVGAGKAGGLGHGVAARLLEYYHFDEPATIVTDHATDLDIAFTEGSIDAALVVAPMANADVAKLFASGYYRLLAIPEAEALAGAVPGSIALTLPPGLYGPDKNIPAAEGTFRTLGVNEILAARTNLPKHDVERLLNAVARNQGWYGRDQGLAALAAVAVPPHLAVIPFYNGPSAVTREEYAAGLMRLGSAFALILLLPHTMKVYRQLRGSRVRDVLREQLEDASTALNGTDEPEALMQVAQDLLAAQLEAERAWKEGNLNSEDLQQLSSAGIIRMQQAMDKIMRGHSFRLTRALAAGFNANTLSPLPQATPERPDPRYESAPWYHDEGGQGYDGFSEGIGPVRVRKRVAAEENATAGTPEGSQPDTENDDQLKLF